MQRTASQANRTGAPGTRDGPKLAMLVTRMSAAEKEAERAALVEGTLLTDARAASLKKLDGQTGRGGEALQRAPRNRAVARGEEPAPSG